MTPSEKQKEIACSFVSSISFKSPARIEEQYESWLLTEEGKRLTAETLITCPACEGERPALGNCECCKGRGVVPDRRKIIVEDPPFEEEVKWLRAAMETQYEAYEALAKETAQDIKGLKQQLDRMEGNMKLTKEL